MSAQTSLFGTPEDFARDVWQRELNWTRRIVENLGAKNVAHSLDIKGSTLSDALAERVMPDGNKKGLRGEWMAVIRHLSSHAARGEYLGIVTPPLGFDTTVIKTRTPDEWKRDAAAWLDRNAPLVMAALAKELGP